jgi:hypothetical protein
MTKEIITCPFFNNACPPECKNNALNRQGYIGSDTHKRDIIAASDLVETLRGPLDDQMNLGKRIEKKLEESKAEYRKRCKISTG